MDWTALAHRVIEGVEPTRDEALAVLNAPDDELLRVLDAAFVVRRRFFDRSVRVHVLQNAKSGVCPEDCSFCSQSLKANSPVEQYGMQTVEELVDGARKAYAGGAGTYCMVTATRGPNRRELETVCQATRLIKAEMPIKVCASLGLLTPGDAGVLAGAGVDKFNHNLETSRRHFPEIVSTHGFDDRLATVRAAKAAGMEACCGGIMGMGEADIDRVDMAFELRSLGVESIPINLLDPRPGTRLGHHERLSPAEGLKALAMMRLVNPRSDVRVAGGREVVLGPMQALALYPATSVFAAGYLTTGGQAMTETRRMIEAAGFNVTEILPA